MEATRQTTRASANHSSANKQRKIYTFFELQKNYDPQFILLVNLRSLINYRDSHNSLNPKQYRSLTFNFSRLTHETSMTKKKRTTEPWRNPVSWRAMWISGAHLKHN